MKKKTFYYSENQEEDFGTLGHSDKPLPKNFKYLHKNIFYRVGSWMLYYLVALPILFCYGKIFYGVKVKNRKALKYLKKEKIGCFLYGNHTNNIDAFISHVFISPRRRSYVISNAAAVTFNKFIGFLVMQLGCLPIPQTIDHGREFKKAMEKRIADGNCIVIYPEAKIWPYYTDVRKFKYTSFKYPVMLNKPVVFFSVTYRKPKGPFKKILKPRITVTLSDVIKPDLDIKVNDAALKLSQNCYDFLKTNAKNNELILYNYVLKK